MELYVIEPLEPFGALIRYRSGSETIDGFSPAQIRAWINQYRILVFRGYRTMPEQDLALYAQRLGKPLQWQFGAINHLKVKPDAENYIFTDHEVPMHWDGAFAGKIPYIILFQCIVAPAPEDGGGTTFADTERILKDASAEQLERWRKISITYTTEKKVHYGGQITQQLVARHPVEDKQVMRYAEPVDDLNPVALKISGLHGQADEAFIAGMKALLYDPRYLYTHRWETGDIVLADNHTLLHGREAFKKANERYIQRVNILARPEKTSLGRFIGNSLTIRRKEFFVAELPIFLIPLLLSLTAWRDLLNPLLYAGLAAIILLFNVGDMINCYADYRLDAIYKSHLSNAVYELGRKNVKWQIILSMLGGLLLTVVVALYSRQPYLIPLTLAGGFIGMQYSVPPFHFKSKGIWQLLCLWGIIFFGPMLYTAIISGGFPGYMELAVFAAYGFHQMGIILLNTAEDYTEDMAYGLQTIIVRLGLHRAMNLAFILVVVSGLVMQALMGAMFAAVHAAGWAYLSIGLFTAGWLKIVYGYRRIISRIRNMQEEDAVKELKKNGMKVPEWLKLGAYTFLAVVVAYFFCRLYS